MDTAWVGVIGGGVGGAVGVVGTIATQLMLRHSQRADREQDALRADHLRYIDERKLAYAEWTVAAREAALALFRAKVKRPAAGPDAETRAAAATKKLRALRAINARISLISKRDVRDAVEAFTRSADKVRQDDRAELTRLLDLIRRAEAEFRADIGIAD